MPLGAQPSAGTGFPCGLTRPRSEKSNTASAPRHWPGLPLRTDLGPDAQLSERLSAWGGLRGRGPGRRGWRQEEAAEPSTPSCAGAPAPAPLATAWHGRALCTRPPDRPLRRAAVQARVGPQCRSQALATRAGVTDRSAESKGRPASPSPGPPAPAAGPSRAGAWPPAPPAAPAAAPGPRAGPAPAPAAARPAPAARGRPPDPAPAPAAAPEAGPAPAPAAARGRGGVCIQVHVPHTPDPTGPCPGLPGRYASLPQAPLSLWGCAGGSGRGPPAGLSHLQDLLVQGAFVLRQRLHQAGHLGQRVPLLHPLGLQPGHQQLQVSVAALGLGRGGRAAVTLRAPQGGALGFWRWDRSEPPSWRCASRSSGRDRAEGVPQEGGPRVLRLPSEVKGCLRGH